jgi:hypothetical protein
LIIFFSHLGFFLIFSWFMNFYHVSKQWKVVLKKKNIYLHTMSDLSMKRGFDLTSDKKEQKKRSSCSTCNRGRHDKCKCRHRRRKRGPQGHCGAQGTQGMQGVLGKQGLPSLIASALATGPQTVPDGLPFGLNSLMMPSTGGFTLSPLGFDIVVGIPGRYTLSGSLSFGSQGNSDQTYALYLDQNLLVRGKIFLDGSGNAQGISTSSPVDINANQLVSLRGATGVYPLVTPTTSIGNNESIILGIG